MNRNRIILLLLCLSLTSLSLFGKENPISHCEIISRETNGVTGLVTIRLRIWANETMTYSGIGVSLPTSWQLSSITYPSTGQTIQESDSVDVLLNLVHPTTNLPFFPASITISLYVNASGSALNLSTSSVSDPLTEFVKINGRIYFTPYNTVEIWSERDFMNLRRTWLNKGSKIDTTRIAFAKSTIPVTNIPADHTITEDWQDDFQLKFVKGLPYAVQMKAVHPDIISSAKGDDGPDSAIVIDPTIAAARTGGRTFRGTITGRLVSRLTNDQGIPQIIPLAGV